jgi:hypothetical protein
MLLQSVICNELYSVIFLDVWQQGESGEKYGSYAVLMMLEGMCGFGAGALLPKQVALEILTDAMLSIFVPVFGIPQLIIVDADCNFCKILYESKFELASNSLYSLVDYHTDG